MRFTTLLVCCFLLSDAIGQEFIITNKIPKTPKVDPQPLPVPIPGASIDWSKVGSLPQRPKVITYGASWCGPCQPVHTAQIANQANDNRGFDWEYIDIGQGALPSEISRKTNSIPCTIIEGFDPISGVITSSRVEDYLKQTKGYAGLSPMSIGTLSKKAIGLSQSGNQTVIAFPGFGATFPSLSPSVTLDPPVTVGSGSIKVNVTRVRLAGNQAVLTAKGWPIEFALDLIP